MRSVHAEMPCIEPKEPPVKKRNVIACYLDPQSMQHNGQKPQKTAPKALFLHTLGVLVSFPDAYDDSP